MNWRIITESMQKMYYDESGHSWTNKECDMILNSIMNPEQIIGKERYDYLKQVFRLRDGGPTVVRLETVVDKEGDAE